MSDITRREALNRLAVAFAAAGVIDQLTASDLHAAVLQSTAGGGPYAPKALDAHQFLTLSRLTDLIIPVEDNRPGAVQAAVPAWIRGAHASVAVRVTGHAPAAALCMAFDGAIVSTSANPAGAPPPRSLEEIDPVILQGVDAVLEGGTGSLDRPTTIRDALTGATLR